MMDAFSIAVSVGLQYGVPLETYVSKFTNMLKPIGEAPLTYVRAPSPPTPRPSPW
ncbi:hypothetical protein SVIOM342S_06634 [Streptomyces violaceorubidus]